MMWHIVAVKDLAVGSFMRPFFAPAVGAAVRSFGDEVKRVDSEMAKHPEDYELWKLGEFEDEDGVLTESESLERLARGVDYVQK